jgi:hypothetical protein
MKYQYFYQNKDNQNLSDWIVAKDRSDAYAQLKKRGIKPYRLLGRNPVAWKRWTAIAVLASCLTVSILYIAITLQHTKSGSVAIPRHQIYGDPAIVQNGIKTDWSACNLMPGEKFISRYAQPGLFVKSPSPQMAKTIENDVRLCLSRKLESDGKELTEYVQLKMIVESIKTEIRTYLKKGGTLNTYLHRLIDRQQQELAYYNAALQEISEARMKLNPEDLYDFWAKKNSELRAIGLPMIKYPGEK